MDEVWKWLWKWALGYLTTPQKGVGVTLELGSGYSTEVPVIQNPSPNYKTPEDDGLSSPREVSLVVVHATATKGLSSPLGWLCSTAAKASAHYLIDRDGTVYQLVDEENVAWHAGVSSWQGKAHKNSVNGFSIGIELVNANDGVQVYQAEQLLACAKLCSKIIRERHLTDADIVGHLDVAPGRKNDPVDFPWDDLRAQVAEV